MSKTNHPPKNPVRYEPRIPSVGSDPREAPGEVDEPAEKIWFRDLDEAVIEAGRCVQCASCVAACPSDSIGIDEEEGRPTLVRMCTGCSSCWDYCPRSGLRYESLVERVRAERGLETPSVYAARAKRAETRVAGQDGGVVTELLATLLDRSELDGALVAREDPDRPLRGVATIATSGETLREAGGSVYNQTMGLGQIDALLEEHSLEDPALAVVGTPCVIQGATALERYDHDSASPFALTVALMCTRSFEYDRLVGQLSAFGVDPASVESIDVTDGVLSAHDADGEPLLEEPVSAFSASGLRGCDECADFLGEAADLSAGSVGSDDGQTTFVVQTERGRRAWELASSALEYAELDNTESMEGLASWNEQRAKRLLEREYDPNGPVGIDRSEHIEAYEHTEREPRPLNPARVHQYEEWC